MGHQRQLVRGVETYQRTGSPPRTASPVLIQHTGPATVGEHSLDKVLTQGHVVEPALFLKRQQGECVRPKRRARFGTTSRGNMSVPLRWAMPCSLYTFTRNKPELGESFL